MHIDKDINFLQKFAVLVFSSIQLSRNTKKKKDYPEDFAIKAYCGIINFREIEQIYGATANIYRYN